MLYSFRYKGTDGAFLFAGLISDGAGYLDGTTYNGGTYNAGTVFELMPQAGGGWTENVLYNFGPGTDGAGQPEAGLDFDGAGNLYGTTYGWGTNGNGTVFELMPKAGGGWREKVLHSFDSKGTDGYEPHAGLILDGAGNLYGTTIVGGTYGVGTVFE